MGLPGVMSISGVDQPTRNICGLNLGILAWICWLDADGTSDPELFSQMVVGIFMVIFIHPMGSNRIRNKNHPKKSNKSKNLRGQWLGSKVRISGRYNRLTPGFPIYT